MKQLLLPLAMLATGWLGAAPCAQAQADESWYQKALQHNASVKQQKSNQFKGSTIIPKQAGSTDTGARNVVSACDVMINGGFETQLATPSHVNNMGGDYAGSVFGGTNRPDQLSNWYSPTAGSPDYFATNATANSEVQPNNENSPYGSFTPYLATSNNDGLEGAIGLYARQSYFDSNANIQRDPTSEYAQVNLNQRLSTGRYYVDFQVSLSHNTSTSLATNYGVNSGFGLVFTDTPNLSIRNSGISTPTLNSRDFLTVPATAQTVFNQSPIAQNATNFGVTGAANWQRVSGQILSTGNLQYVTVGLFNGDASNQIALPNRRNDLRNTYFFVDAIRIFKIPTAGVDKTTFCFGPATIGEGCLVPGATYTWSAPGVAGLPVNSATIQTTVRPTSTTAYTLTVNLPDGTTSSSYVTVNVNTNTAVADPQVLTPAWECVDGPGPVIGAVDNYDPNLTYTVTSTGNIYAYATGPLQQADGSVKWFFRLRSSRAGSTGVVTVKATNTCGGSGTTTFSVRSPGSECNTPPSSRVAGYPNPATDYVQLPQDAAKDARLLDGQGKAIKTPNASGRLDVQDLPDGLYNLQMTQDGKLINQRIQVKH